MFRVEASGVMFKKNNFVVKSSTNIRHSERKALFPDAISGLFNSKQQCSLVKVAFPNGTVQKLFLHDNEPLFFQCEEEGAAVLYPSMYFLWMFPQNELFPVLYVHNSVFGFVQKGSVLMIPGLYFDANTEFSEFELGQPVAISAFKEDEEKDDKLFCFGPMAVGKALMSSMEMRERKLCGQKEKGYSNIFEIKFSIIL